MAKKKGSHRGGGNGGLKQYVKPIVIGLLGGTTGTAIANGNKYAGAGTAVAAQAATGGMEPKKLAVAGITGFFAHDIAVKVQQMLGGVTGGSSSGPYG